MRGLESILGALIAMAMVASLTLAASLLVTRATYTSMHLVHEIAASYLPPRMLLEPLSATCSNGFLPVRLELEGYNGNFIATMYDTSGHAIDSFAGSNGSVSFRIPCDKNVVIVINNSKGVFWVYRYELDPDKYCLGGLVVNASSLLKKCNRYDINVSTALPGLQPLWVRSILIEDNTSLLEHYGPIPGLVLNYSETTLTTLGREREYTVYYEPRDVWARAVLDLYRGVNITYPVYCKPFVGCLYRSHLLRGTVYENQTRVLMHIEYENASLSLERTGWIHISDYRVILPLSIQLYDDPSGESYGWEWSYTWHVLANISKPFFYARIVEEATRMSDNYTIKLCTRKSIAPLYTRTVDLLLVPLLVNKYTQSLIVGFGAIPVMYRAEGKLLWYFNSGHGFTEKSFGPYATSSQYVAVYAYLVPLSEWRTGLPVDINEVQLASSPITVKALGKLVLLNVTKLDDKAVAKTFRINVASLFNQAHLLDNEALLVIEIALLGGRSRLIIDTTNSTNDMGYSLFCNTGIALISAVDAYIHLAILPSSTMSEQSSLLLLVNGEKPETHIEPYNATLILLPKALGEEIKFTQDEINGYYIEDFIAEPEPISCYSCLATPLNGGQVVKITAGNLRPQWSSISVNLDECVSAETVWERVTQLGESALIIK